MHYLCDYNMSGRILLYKVRNVSEALKVSKRAQRSLSANFGLSRTQINIPCCKAFMYILCLRFRASLININNSQTRCNTKQSVYYSASSLYMFRLSNTPTIRSSGVPRGRGFGVFNPLPPKFRRPSKIVPNSTRL